MYDPIADTFSSILRTMAEALLASVAGWVIIGVVGFPLSSLAPRVADYLSISPTFLLPILSGAICAWTLNRKGLQTSSFAFIPPFAVIVGAYIELSKAPFRQHSPWVDLIGPNCGDTECLYQLLVAAPLASASSYSLLSFLFGRLRLARRQARGKSV